MADAEGNNGDQGLHPDSRRVQRENRPEYPFDTTTHDDAQGDEHEDNTNDDYDDDDGATAVPSSQNNSERTASTTTTYFSASSLPSLEGIDMVAATQPSYSSLPAVDDDDTTTLDAPSTVATITITSTTTTNSDHYLGICTKPAPGRLPASPRSPTLGHQQGNPQPMTVQTSSLLPPPPTIMNQSNNPLKRSAAKAVSSNTSVGTTTSASRSTTNTTMDRKRVRRVGRMGGVNSSNINPTTTVTRPQAPELPSIKTAIMTYPSSLEPSSSLSTTIPLHLHHSKNDEKWFQMLQQLKEYQCEYGNTLVPQSYSKLGRWVHYQRVEYWIFQQKGKAKITPERIKILESIGFEWDPQKVQWNTMYEKLQDFCRQHGHAKVPKGFTQNPELANWVRNQRLEHRNWQQGKRSRMTQERFALLDKLGFIWSQSLNNNNINSGTDTSIQGSGPGSGGDS